jgi:cell division protein FtsB
MKPAHLTLGFFFAGLILIGSLGMMVFGDKGLLDLRAMKQELETLKAQNDVLQRENIDLHRRIKRLREDPVFMETIAREEFKMIKKDELVFKFTEDGADPKPDAQQAMETSPQTQEEIPHD